MTETSAPGAVARRDLLRLAAILALTAPGAPARAADAVAVRIDNFAFAPATVTVPAGATVTWTNHDDIPHQIVSVPAGAKSPVLDTDDSFVFTFKSPGQFAYFCSLHPHMQGTVIVTG